MARRGSSARMNEKAEELGLESTSYVDPSGLFNANLSSAYDMARLISYVSGNERISKIMQAPSYTVSTGRSKITVSSTNQLVKSGDVNVQAGKTGFIRSAGYCLVTLAAAAAGRTRRCGRRARREVERGPLLGNAPPVQLACRQGREPAGRHRRGRVAELRMVSGRSEDLPYERRIGGLRTAFFLYGGPFEVVFRPDRSLSRPTRPNSNSRAASPPRRAAASPRCRAPASAGASRAARRTPSSSGGRRRSRTRGTARRSCRTT